MVKGTLTKYEYLDRVTDDGVQTRAHLESQLASSLALGSPNEYRQCLLSYVRFLARYYSSLFHLDIYRVQFKHLIRLAFFFPDNYLIVLA